MLNSNYKILIVLPKLTCGGTERTAAELANFIAGLGGNVTLVLMFRKEKFYELNPEVNVVEPDIPKSILGKYLNVFYILFFLRTQFKKDDPDVIFALGYIAFTLFSSLSLRSKIIISFRSSPNRVRFPNNRILNSAYNLFHWIMRKRVNGVIAQTSTAAEVFRKRYNCHIETIPNFLRVIHNYQIERQNQIINVGHCAFEKGQHFLLKAFAKLNAPEWNLLIVGDGPLKEDLKKLAIELGVDKKVLFAGYQKDVDVFLSKSRIFAFTSIIEGYPNALIEAMATPLPPISFNCIAGPSDIIKDGINGFLVDVGDVEKFASRLQQLIDQPELRERIQQKASLIRQENELSKIAPKYLDFFYKVINS